MTTFLRCRAYLQGSRGWNGVPPRNHENGWFLRPSGTEIVWCPNPGFPPSPSYTQGQGPPWATFLRPYGNWVLKYSSEIAPITRGNFHSRSLAALSTTARAEFESVRRHEIVGVSSPIEK